MPIQKGYENLSFTNYNVRDKLTKLKVGTVTGKKNGEIETFSYAETVSFVSISVNLLTATRKPFHRTEEK